MDFYHETSLGNISNRNGPLPLISRGAVYPHGSAAKSLPSHWSAHLCFIFPRKLLWPRECFTWSWVEQKDLYGWMNSMTSEVQLNPEGLIAATDILAYFKFHSEESTSEGKKKTYRFIILSFQPIRSQLHYLKALLGCLQKSTHISDYLPQISILAYQSSQISLCRCPWSNRLQTPWQLFCPLNLSIMQMEQSPATQYTTVSQTGLCDCHTLCLT